MIPPSSPSDNLRIWNSIRQDSSSSSSKLEMTESSSTSTSSDEEQKYQGIKAFIFDIDGTLADSWKLGFDATQKVLENNGIPLITDEIYHEHTVYCTPDRLARHAGKMPGDEGFEEIGTRLGKEFDDLYVDLVDTTTAGFYEGVESMLQQMVSSDVKLGALTNACVAYAHAVLSSNSKEIYGKFESIHGADSVPQPKPHPDGLFQICKELNLSPSDCVYVGDSPSDGKAAKNAGMKAIGVTWGSHEVDTLKGAPFDDLVHSVEELQSLLLQGQELSVN